MTKTTLEPSRVWAACGIVAAVGVALIGTALDDAAQVWRIPVLMRTAGDQFALYVVGIGGTLVLAAAVVFILSFLFPRIDR